MRLLYGLGRTIVSAYHQNPGSKIYEGFRITEDGELSFVYLLSVPEEAHYPGLTPINKADVYHLKEVPERNFTHPTLSKEIDHPDSEIG